jgi:hypothetical protein
MQSRFFLLIVCLSIFPSFSASGKMLPSSGAAFWQQSRDAAQRGEIDTAMLYLKKAFGQGLSDDSLYFLWSEIYIAKGELDTALALNYAAKPDSAGDLARQILEQRYSIFSSLGWKSEARGGGGCGPGRI